MRARIREYGNFAGSGPAVITEGPDGALWFITNVSDGIGPNYVDRITKDGSIGFTTEYPIPGTGYRHGTNDPWGITSGPDGALWFTEGGGVENGNAIARVTIGGEFTKYPLPEPYSDPVNIVTGSDGALWFTEPGYSKNVGNKIGRITTLGVITEYKIPTPNSEPFGIALGPDGAIWFTEAGASKIGRITTTGKITEYAARAFTEPTGIVAGLNGDLWFNENGGDTQPSAIVRITTAGKMTEYFQKVKHRYISAITRGPDGAIWFCEDQFPTQVESWIGRLGTDGKFQNFPIPTRGAVPVSITSGPGRTLWFTEFVGQNIGELTY
ncbi:MAG: hypothetical protein JO104_08775 [Candidatus Eremiobacteraeota bacterium]|nr:hypothetical protein [Candidatus Eremiobacteraeota bacterium]